MTEKHETATGTAKKSLVVGDCAKLREAMVEILGYIESFHKYITPDKTKGLTTLFAVADTIRGKVRAALAAPPRNCDVGSVEEQTARFTKVCTANSKDGVRGLCSGTCPFSRDYQSECALVWAQMPYEEGGAK